MSKPKNNFIESCLLMIYHNIGIDRPANHDEILEFIVDDVRSAADPEEYHSGDISIAFRRYLEKDYES